MPGFAFYGVKVPLISRVVGVEPSSRRTLGREHALAVGLVSAPNLHAFGALTARKIALARAEDTFDSALRLSPGPVILASKTGSRNGGTYRYSVEHYGAIMFQY